MVLGALPDELGEELIWIILRRSLAGGHCEERNPAGHPYLTKGIFQEESAGALKHSASLDAVEGWSIPDNCELGPEGPVRKDLDLARREGWR